MLDKLKGGNMEKAEIIKCYIYDDELRKILFNKILEYLIENQYKIISMKIRQEKGVYIQIISTESREINENITKYIKKEIGKFPLRRIIDITKNKKLKNRLDVLSNINSSSINKKYKFNEDHNVIIESINKENILSKVYSNDDYLFLESLKYTWISNNKEIYEISKEIKMELLIILLYLVSKKFEFYEYKGETYGCLSFFSHYTGYMNKLHNIKTDKSIELLRFIDRKISDYMIKMNNIENNIEKNKQLKNMLLNWEILISKIYNFHYNLAKENRLYINEEYRINSMFYLDNADNIFHKSLFKILSIDSFFDSIQFRAYRGLVNQVYEIFTLLQINSVNRTIICGTVSKNVFQKNQFNYYEFFKNINKEI